MKGLLCIKRCFDVVLSSVALVFASPIFLVTALAIKAEDGGPVFYTQNRIGRDKKEFQIYKFRSMVVNASEIHEQMKQEYGVSDISFKPEHDPRITKVGRFIRRTCIDELPQLINILKGDMSIVGPRPLPTYEHISEQEEYGTAYDLRYAVPQGLTCIWQISDRREVDFEKRMQMDCQYAEEISLSKDGLLIIQTVFAIIKGNGNS